METNKTLMSAKEAQQYMLDQLREHGRDALISAWPQQTPRGIAYTVTVKVPS
jgi:hypothetical protein